MRTHNGHRIADLMRALHEAHTSEEWAQAQEMYEFTDMDWEMALELLTPITDDFEQLELELDAATET
jgi:creatinine amidohydrolase/Fe(II)-dependent formamide hydrolase-like protein